MVDKTIFDLPEDTSPALGDLIETVDISDTTDDPNGSSKKVEIGILGSYTRQVTGIVSGAVAMTTRWLRAVPEGGAVDNLDVITGLITGSVYIFEADGSFTVTVRDNGVSGGTFSLAGSVPFPLVSNRDKLVCIATSTTTLNELSRATN